MQGERGGEAGGMSTENAHAQKYDFEGQRSACIIFIIVWKDGEDLLPLLLGLNFAFFNRF